MPQQVTFISPHAAFQLTLEPQLPVTSPTGTTSFTAGKRVQFTRGTYVATPEEAVRLGYPTVDALVEAIRSARSANREFYEPGNAPGQMWPAEHDLYDRIMVAAMRRQPDKIRQILEEEQASHNRENVIARAELALGELTEGKEGRLAPGRRPGVPQKAA